MAEVPCLEPAAGDTTGTGGATTLRLGRDRDVLAQEAWRSYFEVSARLRQVLETELKDTTGLLISDYNALLLLWEARDRTLTMSVLARRLVFSPSRLNYRIKVLEEAGLVVKTACDEDKRAHNISLTEAGARLFLDAGRRHRESIDHHAISRISDEELEVLRRVFTRIGDALP